MASKGAGGAGGSGGRRLIRFRQDLVASKGVDYVQGLALSPNGRTLYVSRGYLGDVAAFNIARRRMLWRIEAAGLRADHVALSPDGSRLFVSALTANEVQVIDTRTHRFVGSFPTGYWAHVLEFQGLPPTATG